MQGYRNNPVSEVAAFFGAVLALFFLSCHQVTEFQAADNSVLTFIRSDDFQVEKVMDGFTGGRLLLSHGSGELVLVTSDGVLYRIDVNDFAVDTSFVIGGSSGTGYGDGVFATNGNLYVLGPGSQILEVDLNNSQVVDNFSPVPNPTALAASTTQPRIYVADETSSKVVEVMTSNNTVGFTSNFWFPPSDLFLEPFSNKYLMVGCSDSDGSISYVWLDVTTSGHRIFMTRSPIADMVPLLQDSIYTVCCPEWSKDQGKVVFIQNYVTPHSSVIPLHSESVQGHPLEMTFNPSPGGLGQLSVLARTDEGTSVLTVLGFDHVYSEPHKAAVIDLDGFPRDVASPGYGEYIVVLTSE